MTEREREVAEEELEKERRRDEELGILYALALKDINKRIEMLAADPLTQSRLYRMQYQKALRGQVAAILDKLQGDQFAAIQEHLADSYTDGYVGTMYSMHGQGVPLLIPVDPKTAAKAVMTDSKISEPLYERLGVDIAALKKAITAEITRGIISNMPQSDIARNIAARAKAPLARAKTIVRTEAHRIQQEATYDALLEANKKGARLVKQWDATLDSRTRRTHRKLDGQVREIDEPFEVDGKKAMYPGGFGLPEEDINCRCIMLTRMRIAMNEDELETLKKRAEFFGLDKTKDFEEFRKKFLDATKEK